jgi:hypothetical protein
MKTLILSISQFCLAISFSYCQNNVIPNYSFEEMENGEEEKPTVKSEAQYLRYWERLNTADLYSTEPHLSVVSELRSHLSVVSELRSKYFKC